MIMKYLMAGIFVLMVGMAINLFAGETEIKLMDSTSSTAFSVKDGDSNTILRVQGDGNVGIGTVGPGERLTLGSGNVFLPIANREIDGNLYFGGKTDAGQVGLRLFGGLVNGTEPAGFIDVMTTVSTDGLRFRVDTTAGGTERMRITATGNVGIGSAAPTERLEVAGNIKASGTITPSDFRFKKNILTLNGALDKVRNLRGVSYGWRTEQFTEKGFSDKRGIGIIAQEVEKVVPEVVHTGSDGYKGVEYSKLVPLLIEAIKEQQETISVLVEEVRILKDSI